MNKHKQQYKTANNAIFKTLIRYNKVFVSTFITVAIMLLFTLVIYFYFLAFSKNELRCISMQCILNNVNNIHLLTGKLSFTLIKFCVCCVFISFLADLTLKVRIILHDYIDNKRLLKTLLALLFVCATIIAVAVIAISVKV